jgi:hypothetical protein
MIKSEEIVRDVVGAVNSLERQYNLLKKKDVNKLDVKDLRVLLAYENLKDGAPKKFVEEILKSKDPIYNRKQYLLKQLKLF